MERSYLLYICSLCAILLAPVILTFSNISIAAETTSRLDDIVVTASRYDEKITNVPANVTVISEERIRNSTAQNIPDLLRTEAGVHVSDMSGSRRTYSVDIRGYGETGLLNTLVLVDGRRVNQADLSGTDWAQISLERIQRIEIIRGGRGGVLYGDNASGGVINIITKEGDKWKAGAEAATGSYGTYRTNGYVSGAPVSSLSLYSSGSYMTSSGYRQNSNLESKDGGINLSFTGIDNLKIGLSSGYHKDNTRLPGALFERDLLSGVKRTATTHPNDYANTEDYYAKLSPEYYVGNDAILRLDLSYRKRNFSSYASGDSWNFLGTSGIQTVAVSPNLSLKTDLYKEISNTLITGIDYQWASEDIRNSSVFFGSPSYGEFRLRKTNYGAYLQDEIAIAKQLFLSGGLRRDRADFSFSPSATEKMSLQTTAFNGGLNYKYYRKSYLYFAYSRSFRYPVLDELYNYMTNSVITSLKTQTTSSFEVGTRFFILDDIYLHLNVFRSDTRNELFYNPLTYGNENMGGIVRRNGIEASLSAKITREVLVRLNYSYIDAHIRSGSYNGSHVPNIPYHKGAAEVQYSPFKGFTAALNGSYIGERPFISDFSNGYSSQKGYFVINNRYSYKWKGATLFLDINNITNQKYSEYGVIGYNGSTFSYEKAYYPSPRTNFMSGIRFEI